MGLAMSAGLEPASADGSVVVLEQYGASNEFGAAQHVGEF